MHIDASPALAFALGVSLIPRGVSLMRQPYRDPVPNPPEPEIIQAAADIGIDPQALRDQLDRANLNPPRPAQTDDLPKLLADLADLEQRQ